MRQLFTSNSGRLSNTKVWSFIGCGVASYIMIHLTVKDKMTWEIFVGYLGTVGGFSQISKWLAYRYGVKADVVTATESDTSIIKVEKCSDCSTIAKSTAKPAEQSGD